MDQICPRCNSAQVTKTKANGVHRAGGLLGLLIAQAIVGYNCPTCGSIPLNEFSDDFQSGVKRKRIMLIAGALLLVAVVLGLLVFLEL